jgi:archaellum component FlaC
MKDDVGSTLQDIHERLARVETKIDKLTELLDGSLKSNCEKMGEHIDFVERVYENVKNPLGYVCNKVRFLSGIAHLEALDAPHPDPGIVDEDDPGVAGANDYSAL